MSDHRDPAPKELDREQRKDRKFDVLTLVLAAALVVVVLGAIGYGILNSTQAFVSIPGPVAAHIPIKTMSLSRPDAPVATSTTGADHPGNTADKGP